VATHEAARLARATRAAKLHGIYLIVNEGTLNPVGTASAALCAGVRIFQYRAKHGVVAERLAALHALVRAQDGLLIVNDDWEAALRFDCDGVHLGPDDDGFDAVSRVRANVGDRLIGLSCGTVAEARAALAAGADYVGVGSVYATASKDDAGKPIGIEGLQRVAAAAGGLPVAAVGGIGPQNLASVRETGVAMAAVISAVSGATDPERASRELVSLWGGSAE
jgi:thiamine-phosphate pyrophosphorylase